MVREKTFKKGDVLRRKTGGVYGKHIVGTVATVSGWSGCNIYFENDTHSYDPLNYELVNSETTPHVHHDLIIAWAKGCEIQVQLPSGWSNTPNPEWSKHRQYRVKPKDTVIYQNYYTSTNGTGPAYETLDSAKKYGEGSSGIFKITIDENTDKVKSVELIN